MLLQDVSPGELVARARSAEDLGFGCVWVADHFVEPYRSQVDWYDAWVVLSAIAVGTSRIRIGPLVSTPAFRNPAVLALQAMSVDRLSEGRLELGLGAGGAPLDLAMTGAPAREPAERFERLSELVSIVDALLTEGVVDHQGSLYQLSARVARPSQQPRPPLVIGALSPRALRLAANRADCLNTYAAGGSLAEVIDHRQAAIDTIRNRLALVDAECVRIGRDPASLRRSLLTFFGYLEPLPTKEQFIDWCAPYQSIGIDEFVVYWPSEGAHALEALIP